MKLQPNNGILCGTIDLDIGGIGLNKFAGILLVLALVGGMAAGCGKKQEAAPA